MGPTLNSVDLGFDSFNSKVQSVAEPIAGATNKVLLLEAGIAALATTLVVKGVNASADFSASFNEISTLVTATDEDLEKFRGDILTYSQTSTQSIDKINSAIYNAISAGLAYEDSLDALSIAEKLAVATKSDLDTTLVTLVSSLNAYGVGMESATDFSDALFTAVKQGQTTLPELSASLAQVTGIAAQSGVSFDELLAALAAITSTGVPTSQAVTSIKAALSNILKPTKDAEDAANKLGIKFDATALRTQGLEGFIKTLTDATANDKDAMTGLFGSVEALNGMLVLTGTGSSKFTDSLQAMADKSGSTSVAFDKMKDNLKLMGQVLENSVNALLVGIGDRLQDEAGGITKALSSVFATLTESFQKGDLKVLVDNLEKFLQGVEKELSGMASALPEALNGLDFSGLLTALKALGGEIGGIFELDLTDPKQLQKAIQSIVDAMEKLTIFTRGVVEGWDPFIKSVKLAIKETGGLDDNTVKLLGNIGGISQAISKFSGVVDTLSAVLHIMGASFTLNFLTKLAPLIGAAGTIPLLAAALTAVGVALVAFGIFDIDKWILSWEPIGDISKGVKEFVVNILGLSEAQKQQIQASENSEKTLKNLQKTYPELGITMDNMLVKYDEIEAAENKATEAAKNNTKAVQDQTLSFDDAVKKLGLTTKEFYNAEAAKKAFTDGGIDGLNLYNDGLGTVSRLVKQVDGDHKEVKASVVSVGTAMTETGKKADSALKLTVDQAQEAQQAMLDYEVSMEKIASNERIARIDAFVDLNVADMENQAAIIGSIFEGLTATFQDTGEQISSLFNVWSESDGMDKTKVWGAIQREQERRDESLQAQMDLTYAEIEYMNSKTASLQRGDALISINGDGLKPHLEAFMFEIIEQIQIKANDEGGELLLGL